MTTSLNMPSAAGKVETPKDSIFARFSIGRWPTPTTEHADLAREIGIGALFIKRDDQSAKPYGGSKPRKLELFLGEALASGKREVITIGGVGSHHAVSTAIYGRRAGLEVTLHLLAQRPQRRSAARPAQLPRRRGHHAYGGRLSHRCGQSAGARAE